MTQHIKAGPGPEDDDPPPGDESRVAREGRQWYSTHFHFTEVGPYDDDPPPPEP